MRKITLQVGCCLAAAAFLLRWLEIQLEVGGMKAEVILLLLALFFTAAGIWVGRQLTRVSSEPFRRNDSAINSLGLTGREIQVLELLAQGGTNQQIAGELCVATSTIKTHLIHLYQKLGVLRRTQAVQKARSLQIIP